MYAEDLYNTTHAIVTMFIYFLERQPLFLLIKCPTMYCTWFLKITHLPKHVPKRLSNNESHVAVQSFGRPVRI